MKLEWMGEYRSVVESMIGMCNAYNQVSNTEFFINNDVGVSPVEIQVLEYIIENEERCENMSQVAQRLAISQSNFSKITKKLVGKGLLEKYKTADNNKNIIIQASEFGRAYYKAYSTGEATKVWKDIFDTLNGVDNESIQKFVKSLDLFTAQLQLNGVLKDNKPVKQKLTKID